MKQLQGFLIKKTNGKIVVNIRKTTSVLANQLQVDFLSSFSGYLSGKLLDVGCGEKPYKLIYDECCKESIGVDVETCKHEQSFVDVFASADCLPFGDESFDTILCTNVLEHVANMEAAFSEIGRVLKKGGYAVISVPFLYPVHEAPYDYYRFTNYGLQFQMQKNGFQIEKEICWGGVGLLALVYINLFFGKVLQNRIIHVITGYIQKAIYVLYKKICFNRLIHEKGKISKIITLGHFMIIKKA